MFTYLFTDAQTNKQIGTFIWMRSYRKSYCTRFGVEDFRVGESTEVVDEVAETLLDELVARNKKSNIENLGEKKWFSFSHLLIHSFSLFIK